jgi:hypothetical protein
MASAAAEADRAWLAWVSCESDKDDGIGKPTIGSTSMVAYLILEETLGSRYARPGAVTENNRVNERRWGKNDAIQTDHSFRSSYRTLRMREDVHSRRSSAESTP